MEKFLDTITNTVRGVMNEIANILNVITGGHIRPWHVSLVSFLGHFLVLWALWYQEPSSAVIFLIFFGLMDSLDGALARLQKRASKSGMLLDATSDRLKETLLYTGLTVFVLQEYRSLDTVWLPSAVLGTSLAVSYIKAKGEMAVSSSKASPSPNELNRLFADGLARYEVRMAIIVIGLLTDNVVASLVVLLLLNCITIIQRFSRISTYLDKH